MSTEEFVCDLSPKSFPVTLSGKPYVIREASEAAAAQYRNAALKSARFTPEGKVVGIDGAADVQSLLVSLCLFPVLENGSDGPPVALATVRSWPARVVRKLYDKVREISDLVEGGEADSKNVSSEPPSNTTGISASAAN